MNILANCNKFNCEEKFDLQGGKSDRQMFHLVISAPRLPTFLSEASPITFKCIMTLNRFYFLFSC